jgi:hypothetical protein
VRRAVPAWLLLAACTHASAPGDGGAGDLAAATEDLAAGGRTYAIESVAGCANPGFQTAIARGPGATVGLVTLAGPSAKSACTTMNGPAQVDTWDVCYAESQGAPFALATVTSQQYLGPTGVALAFAPTGGAATIAFTGNASGVAMAGLRCGANTLMMMSGTGGHFGAPSLVHAGSQSDALVPDQASQCIQNICNLGDATGFWPALAFDPQGHPAFAFRDLHYGFATEDFASSDVEYASGAPPTVLTVDVARGGGTYAHLAFTPGGDPAILHYNGERNLASDGIWLNHGHAGAWSEKKLAGARIGEQLGFGVSPAGRFSVAYHDADAVKLVYLESDDGTTWSDPVDVDTDGITGQFPSLAFDDAGEPAIAYYRCNDYDPTKRDCDTERDGLLVARRAAGAWSSDRVTQASGVFDGAYPAIAFAGGKAVVAFQVRSYDPGSGKTTYTMQVAREQ